MTKNTVTKQTVVKGDTAIKKTQRKAINNDVIKG